MDRARALAESVTATDPDGVLALIDGTGTEAERREALLGLLTAAMARGYAAGLQRAHELMAEDDLRSGRRRDG